MIRRCNKGFTQPFLKYFKIVQGRAGFTILEIAISTAIIVIAVLAIIGLFLTYFVLIETSKNTTIAVSDAQAVLEAIRNTEPFTAEGVVANYPQGVNLAPIFNFNKLNNEAIFVSYGSLSADPLQITITINWRDRTRDRTENLMTLMTQR